MSREEDLEFCIQRLLQCPELQDGCEETKAVMKEADEALYDASDNEIAELKNVVLELWEQMETIRRLLERVCREVGELRKEVASGRTTERQKKLF